ncbi:MAG: hypothetical protein HN826_12785 [Methylococcales bacterium]|jgi:hypothetical protein|nr:hypothetical protein [Methylococcales bacterium]
MKKHPLDKNGLTKIIRTTQAIEGYQETSIKVINEVKSLREQYGINVSAKKSFSFPRSGVGMQTGLD